MQYQYTIRKVGGQYQVFRDHKYCRSFATEAEAKQFIAAQTTAKRTLQTVGAVLALLAVLLVNQVAQAHELKPGWKHIPGGVQKCVYDPDLGRQVCTTRCGVAGWHLAPDRRSCVRG